MLRAIAKNSALLFWTLHVGGWSGYALLDYMSGIEVNGGAGTGVAPHLLYAAGGITITYGLRWLFRMIWDLRPLTIVAVGGLGSAMAAALFTGFRSLVYVKLQGAHGWGELAFIDYFNLWDLYISLYVIGTWSGLYFGIRYYRTAQEQKESLLRATSTAHEAQLKMLRYQLNPHFLFNTLNAVSTLVLEENYRAASEMVIRLSAFLRQSLDSDPMQKITLKRELEALQQYLGIEQVRFEGQLRVTVEIEPQAYQALVPSLLLQPVIENAIKHAVARNEDGGSIGIAGTIEDGKLCLRVTDTGPGPGRPSGFLEETTAGVGLSNTRERLLVLYGTRHELELEKLEPSGLAVTIFIPFESNSQEEHPGTVGR